MGMKRIHVVGCGPRSGTTLIAEIMIACFEIDLHTEHETSIFSPPSRRADIFLTKRPRDILVAGPILRTMPSLHVIYMIRDPRDMVVSRHRKDPERYWSSLRYWKKYIDYGERLRDHPRWKKYIDYGERLRDHPRFITLRYEDLVREPDVIQELLMERMPFLEKRTEFSQYHNIARPSEDSVKALRGVRAISAGSIGNWRSHLPRVAGQVQVHGSISEDLIRFGYEEDESWLGELEGVEPDLNESHWPEHFSRRDLRVRKRGRYVKAVIAPLRNRLYPFLRKSD